MVPYIFDHATSHFGMFGMFASESVSKMDGAIRELAITRAGYTAASQFVYLATLQGRPAERACLMKTF